MDLAALWPATSDQGPWFHRRPVLSLVIAGLLFASVLAVRLVHGTPVDAYSLLYVFPVALVATTFGRRGGIAAGLLAVALMVLWAVLGDVTLTVTGWASRVVPMLVLGALVGDAADRLRHAERERRRLEAAALLHREAIEINDRLVQGMAAAKWSLEAGRIDAGISTLDATIAEGHALVSALIKQADMSGRSAPLSDEPTVPRQDEPRSAAS